jgi:hypothetical protein
MELYKLGKERADQWDQNTLNNMLAEEFEKLMGPMTLPEKDNLLTDKMQALKSEMMRDDWLLRRGKGLSARNNSISGRQCLLG